MNYKLFIHLCLSFFLLTTVHAQEMESRQNIELTERIQPAPESVFKMFREAEMNPVNHVLTEIEKQKVEKAFSILPSLHQKILKEHLHSISFMDNMPNTALTSPVETSDSTKKFNITFRFEILHETISEWTTWKENTYYDQSESNEYEVSIDAGELHAIVYILLHEATHVVDGVLNITPHPHERDALVEPTPFTRNIWYKMNVPTEKFINPLLEKTRFRSGKPISIMHAAEVYEALQKTPFASLYSMASWFEDLAEMVTIYHLTERMNQPFRISVKKNDIETVTFEPMKNKLVKRRLKQLDELFYE